MVVTHAKIYVKFNVLRRYTHTYIYVYKFSTYSIITKLVTFIVLCLA